MLRSLLGLSALAVFSVHGVPPPIGSPPPDRLRLVGRRTSRPTRRIPNIRGHNWSGRTGKVSTVCGNTPSRPRDAAQPEHFDGQILVPFPVESALSGVMKRVGPEKRLWYRREVSLPATWNGKRILLHFEAVDWEATVSIDGRTIGTHRGGYAPFTFDVTDALTLGKPHSLVALSLGSVGRRHAAVWQAAQQTRRHLLHAQHGHLANRVARTGLRERCVESVECVTDIGSRTVSIKPVLAGPTENIQVSAEITGDVGAGKVFGEPNQALKVPIMGDAVKLWSPDSPFLYQIAVQVTKGGSQEAAPLDRVESYFAARTISVSQGPGKKMRIRLNGKPVFLLGPLDQGFWPDGLYTAPTDEALKSDIEVTKQLGFNFIRKHVKVEPARWYYWCDRLGVAVFQDMPSGDQHAPELSKKKPEIKRTTESTSDFDAELKAMIDSRRQFPCIIGWVPFNEGWGQFDTVRIAKWIKSYDPTRLVDPASGWNDFPVGDMHDIHDYPGPSAPKAEAKRAAVLGEFGGLGLPIPGHLWVDTKKNWGYRRFTSRDALTEAYLKLAAKLRPLVSSHLSAAVYTQTTDCETEVNGLMTYDRELIKMDVEKIHAANTGLVHLLSGGQ